MKNKLIISTIFVIAVLAISSVLIFGRNKDTLTGPPLIDPTFTPTTGMPKNYDFEYEVTDDPDRPGWQIYLNKTLKYKFSFPDEVEVVEDENGYPKYATVESPDLYSHGGYALRIGKQHDTTEVSFEKFVDSGRDTSIYINKCRTDNATATPLKETTVSGRPAYMVQVRNCGNWDNNIYKLQRGTDLFAIVVNAVGDNRNTKMEKGLEILSSLEFLE